MTVQLVPYQSIGEISQQWDVEFGSIQVSLQQVVALIDSHNTLETNYLPAVAKSSNVGTYLPTNLQAVTMEQ